MIATEETYQRRVTTLLDNLWNGEVATLGEAIEEERQFELVIEDPSGAPPVVVTGSIDRIDRLPSGGVEVTDYKTGKVSSQKGVDESLQLSIYALACRDALGLGGAEARRKWLRPARTTAERGTARKFHSSATLELSTSDGIIATERGLG